MRTLATAALLALALTACGDDGPSEDDLRDRAETFYAAFFEADNDTAYPMLTDRCQGEYSEEQFGALLDTAVEIYGAVEVEIDSIKVDGNEGRIDATTGVPALDEPGDGEPQWVFEDGEWKSDACD